MHSNFSTSVTNNTTIGSTKGFFSFSNQTVLESQKGPTFIERIKSNILHISANIHRYTDFSDIYHNVSMVIRLIQSFCVYLLPQSQEFWKMNSTTLFFNYLLEIPLHLCFMPSNVEFHAYFLILLFLFFTISTIFLVIIITRNPTECSISDSVIFYLSFYLSVLTPIMSTFVFSLFGAILNLAVFQGNHDALVISSCVLGSLAVVFVLISHYFSYYIMRGASMINFSLLFIPWAPYISIYAHYTTYNLFLAFLGEFIDVENKYYQIGFSIFSLLAANPVVIFYLFYYPIFQDLNDTVYLATVLTVNMISVVLMDFRFLTSKLTPVVIFVVAIISFVFFLILYSFLMRKILMKYMRKMFTTYKHTKPCLPPTTPLVFTTPMPMQGLLSHEAYLVMQAFSSLEITTIREYHYFMFVGTYLKMSALKNIDFIKWGLNYFHDTNTLIICAQICQYFKDNSQTQAVLIQRLNETNEISFFMTPVVYNLVLDHADAISDKPAFMKKLQKKAYSGLVRCRRALSIFWGSVLKHSSNAMTESLCKMRDTIYETRIHFDELIRCYPISLEVIALYLDFMTEICGDYIKCNRYINQMSSKFIEMKSDAIENDESVNGISVLLNDPNRSFSPYLMKLTQYLDQESRTHTNTKGPIIAIWSLGIISGLTLIICILVIMVRTLVSFNEYPQILSIVNNADDVFIEMASLIIGIRRVCLFASGSLAKSSFEDLHGMVTSIYEEPELLLPWLIQKGEVLPQLILRFYKNVSNNIEILNIVKGQKRKFKIYGSEVDGSLDFIMDMMSMAVRNIAVNIPSYFTNLSCIENNNTRNALNRMKEDMERRPLYNRIINSHSSNRIKRAFIKDDSFNLQVESISNYSGICDSSEMRLLLENIETMALISDDFILKFQEISERKVKSLSKLLYYSMILFPICYVVIFGLILFFLCYSLKKESNFRLTLFLSLPETVAFEIYNTGGKSSNSRNQLTRNESRVNQVKSATSLASAELLTDKEKALRIESLYQFSTKSKQITGIGIKEFAISSSIFIFIATLSIFFLTFYSRSVNETFQSRSFMLCTSALRYSSVSYASMFLEEGFILSPCLSIFNTSEIIRLSTQFLRRAHIFHQGLTYGNTNIKFDFHEYKTIEKLVLNEVKIDIPENLILERSHALLQHNGYQNDSFDTFMSLFVESSSGIIETLTKDHQYYKLNGSTWQNYNHLIVSHLRSDLKLATNYYITGVSEVIEKSFAIGLVISILVIAILVIILFGPTTSSSIAISRYFATTLHILCQVPPEVFSRSFYINQWLKGQISNSNYKQYETTFKRTISFDLQKKILQDSNEKVIVFNTNGNLVETPCFDFSSLKEKSLTNVLNFIIENIDQNAVDDAQRAFACFQESKDIINNIEVLAKSTNTGKSTKLTFTGITSADLSSSVSSLQRYYSNIIILVKDVTEEEKINEIYVEEMQKILNLYKQVMPYQLTSRVHDGESSISFSATIGSVLSFQLTDYNESFEGIELNLVSEVVLNLREIVFNTLYDFNNISLISISGNEFLFVAGLFNDEQNGRTETIDTFEFASCLFNSISDVIEKYNLDMNFKMGIATGGPIFCKFISECYMTTFISGETVVQAKIIRDLCCPGQLAFDRTTFECSEGLNIEPQQAGKFKFHGNDEVYYSIVLNKNDQIILNDES